MELSAEHYYRAGLERMRQAWLLYRAEESLALAMYVGGLGVECLLRAYRWKRDPSFSGRHDLVELFTASGLLAIDDNQMQAEGVPPEAILRYAVDLRAAVQTVVDRWANDFRFASEQRLRARLRELGRYKGKKGDILKANALELLNAAQKIIDRGIVLWTSKRK